MSPSNSPTSQKSEASFVADIPILPEHQALGVVAVKPGANLTEEQRRKHVIGCLKSIAVAMERYLKAHGQYPNRCVAHEDFGELLSWRVALLPYLGYEDLYRQFELEQKWDSPANRQLLSQIPPVYRSPERADTTTNYQLFTGSGTSYASVAGTPENLFLDGLQSTLLLAEFDDSAAVPWTKPEDFKFQVGNPRAGLFSLRGDGFFAVFGGGVMTQVRESVTDAQLRGVLTLRGDESVNLSEFVIQPSENRLAPVAKAVASNTQSLSPADTMAPRADSSEPIAEQSKQQPPVGRELAAAESLIKSIYENQYKRARTPSERIGVASRMLSDAEGVKHDLANYFVMLRIARDIATALGEIDQALQAQMKIGESFTTDTAEFVLPWLETAVKRSSGNRASEPLFELTLRESDKALKSDDFGTAEKLQQLAASIARNGRLATRLSDAGAMEKRISQNRRAYRLVSPALHTLVRSPADPSANALVGRYLCLNKGDWDKGINHLAQGNDVSLKTPALLELQSPTSPEAMAALGDLYWSLAESWRDPTDADALRERGTFWYRKAVDQLPEGLRRILVLERLANSPKTPVDG